MKSKILKGVTFVLILILGLCALSRIVIPKNNSQEAGMHDFEANGILAEKENTIDVLIIGDSEAFTAISPMEIWNQYGFTCYSCCSTEQTVPESATKLIKALQRQKPKIIIVEPSNMYRASNKEEHLEQVLYNFLPIIEYHNRWKNLNKDDWVGKVNYDTINDFKGYHFTKETIEATPNTSMKPTDEIQDIPTANKIYFELLKKYCEKKGIMLSLIRTPTTFSWDYKSYNGIKQLADNNRLEYIDLNVDTNKVDIDWKHDSKDGGDHLNHYGAVKTSKFLSDYLNDKNILQDHRDDDTYNSWHESYKRYKEIVSN